MTDRLYNLLPAMYRIRDAEHGRQLRALLGIIEQELEVLEQDVGGLYDDWFIETCAEWVVPYIGDLLGVRMLHKIESSAVYSRRAFVANTISYRQRKGTLLMLEDLARDLTGWGGHAVAFFELLGWTQHLNHLRFDWAANPNPRNPQRLNSSAVNRVGTVNLRSLDVVDRLDGPFDLLSHTADIRQPSQQQGWHNIHNVGIFLWRLQSYPLTGVRPEPSETCQDCFHFSPLGNPAPLFTNPGRKTDEKRLATEVNVPASIRPLAFFQNPKLYYGSDSDMSLAIYRGTEIDPTSLVPLSQILCKDLRNWSPPPAGMVAVDVRLGRFAFAPGETPEEGVVVSFHYGFSADIGGGPYDRRQTLAQPGLDDWTVTVAKKQPEPPPLRWYPSIAAAYDDWDPVLHPRAVFTVADNATYDENLSLTPVGGSHLILQAENLNRPTIRFRDEGDPLSVLAISGGTGEKAALTINGLVLEGSIHIQNSSLGKLEIIHSTLVPGRALDEQGRPVQAEAASIEVAPESSELKISILSSITGSLRLPEFMGELTVRDSIIDRPEGEGEDSATRRIAISHSDTGDEIGPACVLERTTIFGEVYVQSLNTASEVIFSKPVQAARRQVGCVRYSYVDDLRSTTPRRFRCQPDLALENRKKQLRLDALSPAEAALIRSRLRPDFTSECYGHPAYGRLSLNTAPEICTGAEDGSEMGVFEHLKQPQREANLRNRFQEYLPYGLTAGIIYAT